MTLTKSDLDHISKTITVVLEANNKLVYEHVFRYIDITCSSKKDIEDLKERLSHLPNKDEFYTKMDKWMKQVTDKTTEKAAHSSRHTRTDDRLDKIEAHLGISYSY